MRIRKSKNAAANKGLSPVPCKVDQKRCQTCLFLLIGMLACLCPNPSIPSQPTVTDRIFLRQDAFEALLCTQTLQDTESHGCARHISRLRIQITQNGAGTCWNTRSSSATEFSQSKKHLWTPFADHFKMHRYCTEYESKAFIHVYLFFSSCSV